MKNTILLILFSAMSSALPGQIKLVEEGNQWNIVIWPTFEPDTISYSYTIGTDTVVDGLLYHRLLTTRDSNFQDWQFTGELIREDAGRIWTNNQGLIYDFNLQIADTFFMDESCYKVIIGCDTITTLDGVERKRLHLEANNGGSEQWIEGIGTNLGLTSHIGICRTDYTNELLCFYHEDLLVYQLNNGFCFFVSSTLEQEESLLITSCPNPVHNSISFHTDNLSTAVINFYDYSGKLIKTEEDYRMGDSVHLNELPAGSFIAKIYNQKGRFALIKFIKTH